MLRTGTANAANQRRGPASATPDGSFQLPPARTSGSGASPADGAAALAATHGWLALQDLAERDRRRRRSIQSGVGLLEGMEQLYRDLLDGDVGPERARNLTDLLRRLENDTDDPRLKAMLHEIELRCAVELAKLGWPDEGGAT